MRTAFVLLALVLFGVAVPALSQELPHLMVEDIGTVVYVPPCSCFAPMDVTVSPDGQWLAYINCGLGTEAVEGLYIKPMAGGDERFLFNSRELQPEGIVFPDNYVQTYHPVFTPDSKEITFYTRIFDESLGSDISSWKNPIPYIKSIDIETDEIRDIAIGSGPEWDVSGRYLYYRNYDYRVNIEGLEPENHLSVMVLDTLSGESRVFDDFPSGEFVFTPDGEHILYNGDFQQIFSIPTSGGDAEQITFIPDNEYHSMKNSIYSLVISPDGKWLFFQRQIDVDYDTRRLLGWPPYIYALSVLELETGKMYDVIPFSDNLRASPVGMAPDGKTLFTVTGSNELSNRVVAMDFNPDAPGEPVITAVEDATPAAYPTLASYPNPFNSSTTISFILPEAGFTELAVYNMAGQKIRTLIACELSPGVHEAVWDGRDDSGNPVSSGIFVSRLATGKAVVTNRMTLVK